MGVANIIAQIDQEIAQLQHARALLSGASAPPVKRPVGRPPKAAGQPQAKPVKKKRRKISAEGRKRIAEAARKRWAEQRKAASK